MTGFPSYTRDPSSVEDRPRMPLSAPHLTGRELEAVTRALQSNWLGPIGPEVAAFEAEFAAHLGVSGALATTSGTAALHLALRVLGVGPGDEVLVSTLTFCASVNPIVYQGATPAFVDAEYRSWNLDPALLAAELERRGRRGELPAAVVVVHLFGQLADMAPIVEACARWGVPLVEDAAEALGAVHLDSTVGKRPAGTFGDVAIFSFDASKIITTSIGGMLVSSRTELVEHARKLARQAREPVPHYEHLEIGYNYRMSNLLAAFGRVQLEALPDRVKARRSVFEWYAEGLRDVPGIELQPEAPWGLHTRWLSCILIDPAVTGLDREAVRRALLAKGMESRPIWKPMHLQPVYRSLGFQCVGGAVAEDLFERGLCLPSSSFLTREQVAEACDVLRSLVMEGGCARP
jgi:dTDP-4-amino-4,6-dideoxygalactose transaminase